jgi:hypothetical protein
VSIGARKRRAKVLVPLPRAQLTLSGFLKAQRSTQLYEAFSWPSGNQAMSPASKPPERTVLKGTSQEMVSLASCAWGEAISC